MNQDIRRKLDRITDILWAGGVTNPVTYIEQLMARPTLLLDEDVRVLLAEILRQRRYRLILDWR